MRLLTLGAETKAPRFETFSTSGGDFIGNTTIETTTVRTGVASIKSDSGAGNTTTSWPITFRFATSLNRNYYIRCYFRVPAAPSTDSDIVSIAAGKVRARLKPDLTLVHYAYGSVRGSASSAVAVDTWHLVELRIKTVTGFGDEGEMRLNGVQVGTTATSDWDDAPAASAAFGWNITAPGANKVIYFDDVAINDDQGTTNNSWPGAGNVVLLLPTSDNAAGSWKKGSGGSAADFGGTGYDAINNTPPVGTTSPNATTAAISNAVSGATTPDADFNMATYSAAGVPAGATIKAVQMCVVHGEDISTGTKTGTFKIVSNPDSGTAQDLKGYSSSQFGPDAGGAVNTFGNYPVNWISQIGSAVEMPSVTLGTAPVARITKTDLGTYAADCCFMGIYVDYVVANVTVTPGTASLTVTRFAPTVTASDHKTAIPGMAGVTITPFAPTVAMSDNQTVVPGVLSLTMTRMVPVVVATGGAELITRADRIAFLSAETRVVHVRAKTAI